MYTRTPIPEPCREKLAQETQICELCGKTPVQWHHHLTFAGKAVQEKFAIIKLCHDHHDRIWDREIKRQVDRLMLQKMNEKDMVKYPWLVRVISRRYESDKTDTEGIA